MHKELTIALALLAAPTLKAVELGPIDFGGNGCKLGENVVAHYFDDLGYLYVELTGLAASNQAGARLSRSSCNMAVPVKVPAGKKLVVRSSAIYGQHAVGAGVTGKISSEVFFAGSEGIKDELALPSAEGGETYYGLSFGAAVLESACGQDVTLRQNSAAFLKSEAGAEAAQASVTHSLLELALEDCEASKIEI